MAERVAGDGPYLSDMVAEADGVTFLQRNVERGDAIMFGFGAYALWGLMPVYFLLMRPAGPFEIVAWRVVFSLVFCVVLLAVTRGFRRFRSVLADRSAVLLFGVLSAITVADQSCRQGWLNKTGPVCSAVGIYK